MPQASNIHALQIPHSLRLSAAERLVQAPARRQAAKRLVASATSHGIDLDLMWGVNDGDSNPSVHNSSAKKPIKIRQVTLAVLGSGRTAMMFLSSPEKEAWLGTQETQIAEISCSLKAALTGLRAHSPEMVTLAQTLIEPEHTWAQQACCDAGMISVGQLDYMRKPIKAQDFEPANSPTAPWPTGIEVRAIRTLDPNALDSDRQALIDALEGSYQDTLDCPELCGLRSMDDVVESHMATGDYSPSRWHLIFNDGQPAGCCLLTHVPQSDSVELVYLGIAPIARGLGLGKRVLAHAIAQLGRNGDVGTKDIGIKEVTCAVDNRNTPAIGIYESLGFSCFDARVGFVSAITGKA